MYQEPLPSHFCNIPTSLADQISISSLTSFSLCFPNYVSKILWFLTYVCEHACLCLCVHSFVILDMLSCRASADKNKKRDSFFFFCIFSDVFRRNMQNRFLGRPLHSLLVPLWWSRFVKWLQERGDLRKVEDHNSCFDCWLWPIEGNLLHRKAGQVASHLLPSNWIPVSYKWKEGMCSLRSPWTMTFWCSVAFFWRNECGLIIGLS